MPPDLKPLVYLIFTHSLDLKLFGPTSKCFGHGSKSKIQCQKLLIDLSKATWTWPNSLWKYKRKILFHKIHIFHSSTYVDFWPNHYLILHNFPWKLENPYPHEGQAHTGKSLSEALLFVEHEENMLCMYKNCSECQKQFL